VAAGRLTATLMVVGGVVLFGISLQHLRGEAAPYLLGGVGSEQRFESILAGELRPASSRWSKDLFLNDCLTIPRSVYGLLRPSEAKLAFAESCRVAATAITAEVPVYSLAWLVSARSAGELGDLAFTRAAIQQARRTAPDVQWLAARRTSILDQYTDLSERESDAGYTADLLVMLRGPEATRELAGRYLRNEELRAILTKAAELSDPDRQRAFLGEVRQQAAGRRQ
jgi:hypothetical protein